MCVNAPTKNPKKNSMLCSLTRPPNATAQTLMKRKGIVELESEVKAWWKIYQDWMALEVIEGTFRQEHSSTLEVDAFMENCAKRWQRREGTYQLKRRRLPDVRDAPGYQGADIDMADI